MSTIETDPVASAAAATAVGLHPGTVLKQAREARSESLNEVAQALKLSLAQLSAIESGKFETLPGPTFVRGFVRNYARHLGLDAEPLLKALEAGGAIPGVVTGAGVGAVAVAVVDLTPVSNARGDMPTSDEQRQRASYVPMTLVIVSLLILIAGGLYFGWFETQPVPQAEDVEQSEPEIIPDGENTGTEEDTLSPSSPESPAAAAQSPAPAEVLPPVSATTVAAVPAVASAPTPTPAPASAASPAPANPAPVNGLKPGLRLNFGEDAWFEVREGKDGSGKLLVSGVGTAGSSRNVQGTPPFFVVLGNAGMVKIEFNGKSVDLAPYTNKKSVASLTLQ
ncbi:hypothetical protein FACS1894116_11670 [Betaproteobacteria bacterium]|nr:hypothetical protein FACS1894116_11670 [Betaproteobacteria bacterium]